MIRQMSSRCWRFTMLPTTPCRLQPQLRLRLLLLLAPLRPSLVLPKSSQLVQFQFLLIPMLMNIIMGIMGIVASTIASIIASTITGITTVIIVSITVSVPSLVRP